jgi:hypothetical protein
MYEHITHRPNPYYANEKDPEEPYPSNISIVGWEGDDCSVIVTMTGTFYARYGELRCHFGIARETGPITWENHSGYLPCLVTSFNRNGVEVKIAHFCNKVKIDDHDYVLLFTRVIKTNKTDKPQYLPADPDIDLIRLTPRPGIIQPGSTETEDFVTPVDKFGQDIPWPKVQDILTSAGTWDENFEAMRSYWNNRLSTYVQIERLPDERLVNAFKAGTIYQLIVMRGLLPAVGVNAYRDEFNHDIIGMVETMIECGDLDLARKILDKYRDRIPAPLDYPDGNYKYPWPWTVYLLKSGDIDFVRENFHVIKRIIHESAENDMTGPGGIMRESWALDHPGYWLVDNWSFLTGLAAYRVLCERLGEASEAKWALEIYDKLLNACNKAIEELSEREGIDYLPCSMVEANPPITEKNRTSAGWATHLHFGRWPWEAYILGARQEGIMLERIDSTYDWGFAKLKDVLPSHTFGGFSEWCTSYNAGFAFAALRGEKYRDEGIRAYQFMIDNAMSGPFSWWESIDNPDPNCPWTPGIHPREGRGSCPHMWGDSFSRKILLNSLICEFADGRVLIGRGIPKEWLEANQEIKISNVPLQEKRRFGYTLTTDEKSIHIVFTGDIPAGSIILDLPLKTANSLHIDGKAVQNLIELPFTIPANTKEVVLMR